LEKKFSHYPGNTCTGVVSDGEMAKGRAEASDFFIEYLQNLADLLRKKGCQMISTDPFPKRIIISRLSSFSVYINAGADAV